MENKEEKKDNKKIVRGIIVVLGIIVILYLLFIMRNSIILNVLHNKNMSYENNNNIYKKVVSEQADGRVMEAEVFYKDGTDKTILSYNGENVAIQIDNADTHKFFSIKNKRATIQNNQGLVTKTQIPDFTETYYGFWGIFVNGATNLITSANVNGVECYKITGPLESIIASAEIKGFPSVYIEKETGLPVKCEQTLKDGRVITTTYEFEFGVVTDEDLSEPDLSEYEIEE